MRRGILRAFTARVTLGIFWVFPVELVAGLEERALKIVALSADSQSSRLLMQFETGVRDNQAASSAGLLDLLVLATSPVPRPLRQQRHHSRRALRGGQREKSRRPIPPSGLPRARGRQGRFAPRRGDLAFGEAIPDSPSERRTRAQVGSGKWF
jgi:hypothetical protein